MTIRALRLSLRNVDGLVTAVVLPVLLILMFVYLFGGAIKTGAADYVDYVVPGVLLVCVGFGAGTTGASVATDLAGGTIDRLRSMDVRAEALIGGHVLASVARNLVSTAVVVAVAFAIGFHSHAGLGGWLATVGILVLFILALSWVAAAIGVLVHSAEAASGVTLLISFLAYPSSAFVPVATMPRGLREFAEHQPVTQVIDAIRALLAGAPAGDIVWHAVIWSVAIAGAAIALAGVFFRRRTE